MSTNREVVTAYGLGAVGAVAGVFRYYVRLELTAKRAWVGLGVGIALYELAAPQGELLSEGVDRAIEQYPKLTVAVIGAVALHLCNKLPEQIDPLHQSLELVRGIYEQNKS